MFNDLMVLISSIPLKHLEWLLQFWNDLILPIILMCFFTMMVMEASWSTNIQARRELFKSYKTNIGTLIFNNAILSMLSATSLLVVAEKYADNGLLKNFSFPAQIVISFILFDFILYIWHRANHELDCLWIFHKIHHSDKSMNASTTFRVHLVEVFITTLIKALTILLTGVESVIVFFCEGISTLFVMFHHTNYPYRGEKWFSWLFIVPSQHRVHHSVLRREHDSNYGAVFSVWDRLFKSLIELTPHQIGLVNIKALNFNELLRYGFYPGKAILTESPETAQVPISVRSASSRSVMGQQTADTNAMIAEAAYYIAEKRGFVPGKEFLDWFEAEQQINRLIMG